MSIRKITVIVGTRPEFIKIAPVVLACRVRPEFAVTFIATAQQREMLDQASRAFGIEPDVDLGLMRPDQTLAEITARVTTKVQSTLAKIKPDAVLVHGDT